MLHETEKVEEIRNSVIKELEKMDRPYEIFLHKECKPINEIDFYKKDNQLNLFNNECEGMCGV